MDEREVFFSVVEQQGFTAAATKLGTTAAAVSRKVKALEQRLGVRLLHRSTRKTSLTAEGRTYYQQASALFDQLNLLEQELTAQAGELCGELRISAPMSFGQKKLAPLISRFASRHARLRVSLILEDRQSDIIGEGFDLTLRIGYPADSSLVGRKLAEVPVYLCASPDYLRKHGTPETPAQLASHQCLHYNLISEREEWTLQDDGNTQSILIKSRFCSNNGDVLTRAAIDGLGIIAMPDFIVEDALASGQLVRVLTGHERHPMSLYALYPSRSQTPAKTREMIDYLLKNLQSEKLASHET